MNFCLFLYIICGLSYEIIAKGQEHKGKYSVPSLDVTSRQLVLEPNQTLLLNCRGRWELVWRFPSSVAKEQRGVQVEEHRCGRTGALFCSRLIISPTLATHTGSIRCQYRHRPHRQASVYIYVADSRRPFVELQGRSPSLLYMKEGEPLVIPCRATHPNHSASLVKFPNKKIIPDHRNIIWNTKQGITIRRPNYFYIGLFFCQTTVEDVVHSSHIYFVHRPVNKVMKVYLNTSGPVEALRGDIFALNCTATGELNTRVNFSWDYPGKDNGLATISKRIINARTHMLFYTILTVPKLQRSDRGVYACHVSSGQTMKRQASVNVTVYDRPFIRLKARHGTVLEANAGQRAYRLSLKLRAFPAPELIWFKDGAVAAERCSRYLVDGNSLVIRDVAEEDAGKYTVLARLPKHNLFQNLTLTLVVNVSPQIGEKAATSQDPGTVPRGSRQALRCTSDGAPPPHIQWLWQPCPSKALEVCSATPSLWRSVGEKDPSTSTHNHIMSVDRRQEVLRERNKTVGVLTVAEAFVSGIYRCVASNSVGMDILDIPFYVTDVPGGFSVSQGEGSRERGDLRLTCMANKYIYKVLSWQRVTDVNDTEMQCSTLNAQFTAGEYSRSLSLLLSNLTSSNSGIYRCSALHLLTGQKTHLDTQVFVTALEAPVLLQNLSDCTVNASSSLTLRCPARGVPNPVVTWYKSKRTLSQGSGIMVAPDHRALHIERITVEDQGLYTCRATNEKGSAESSAYIWVNGRSQSSLEIPTLTCTCVVVTLFWLMLTLFIRKLKQPSQSNNKPKYLSIILDTGEAPADEQCDRLQYDPNQWEFPREHLKLETPLGRGAFGKVIQATAFGIGEATDCVTVAVKMLKEGATDSEHKALMTELKILNHIGNHLNVVNLLGACTMPGGPLMIVVEYCRYGNLSSYLKSKRELFVPNRVSGVEEENTKSLYAVTEPSPSTLSVSSSPLFLEDLISFSFQVARGMEFLSSRKCIHRDLAARNVLLSDNNVVKICDFGLARDVYKDPDYVRKGDARLPLKWMSPESIFDKVFTTQSDVWAYGILLWEIFSLGASPYPGLHIDEDFCQRLKGGTRMRAPEYSTPEIYCTMLICWEAKPSDRPMFTDLVGILGDLLQATVQQEGKAYIPLGSFACGNRGSGAYVEDFPADQQPHAVTNLGYMRGMATLQTFEELPCLEPDSPYDEQSDSGMVLPSEEMKRLSLNSGIKTSKLSRFFNFREIKGSFQCNDFTSLHDDTPPVLPFEWDSERSPPPDYNSTFAYPSH